MQTDSAPPPILLFFKAAIAGAGAADLFADKVAIAGYTTEHGTYVAPHRAIRHKKRPQIVRPVPQAQQDLFAAPGAPKAKPKEADTRQASLFDAPPAPKPKAAAPPAPAPKPAPVESTPAPEPKAEEKPAETEPDIEAAAPEPEETPAEPEPHRKVEQFGVPAGTTPGQRKKMNARAVKILAAKTDEEMTQEDREALAKYSGNGTIGDDLSEFYTPEPVADAMWKMLRNAGFTGGTVLEPSCGTGIYAHTAPDDTRLSMVEMQPTSARIAKILHGPAGHETRQAPLESFATTDGRLFDAVIGNVPFCPRGGLVKDDKGDLPRAEQYFVDTALDKCRDGGLVALMVPTSIMDSKNLRSFRQRIMAKGEFIGGVRMPNTCFKSAHTEVTTDILMFRKRPQEVAGALSSLDQDQLKAAGVWDPEFLAGTYFEGRGSPHVMGRVTTKMGQFGPEMTVDGSMSGIPEALAQWTPEEPAAPSPTVPAILESLGDDDSARRRATSAALKTPYQVAKPGDIRVINGARFILQGEPPRWQRAEGEVAEAVEDAQKIAEYLEDLSEGRARDPAYTRAALIEALDQWVASHGTPTRNRDLRAWLAAPNLPNDKGIDPAEHHAHVQATYRRTARILGAVNEDGTYSDLVTGREHATEATDLETTATKLALDHGGFTPDQLAAAAGVHVDTVLDRLHASADFAIEADGRTWNTMDGYMTGSLWPKLDAARIAADEPAVAPDLRAKYQRQAAELEKAIDPKSLEDVEITLASGFIQPEDIEAWFAARDDAFQARNPGGSWSPGKWKVTYKDSVYDFRDKDKDAPQKWHDAGLIQHFLNRDGVRKDDLPKLAALNREFKEWLLCSDRREAAEDRYNRLYRGFRARVFSNTPIHVAGLAAAGLKEYQWGGVRWALANGSGIIAADVGLGKTARGLILAKLAKQTGQAKRPAFVVPKSVVQNWVAEADKWFPGSRVLVIGESMVKGRDGKMRGKSDDAETRKQKLQSLQQNDYDFVFISQPAWNTLDVSPNLKERYQLDDFWERRAKALEGAKSKKVNKLRTAFDQQQAAKEFEVRDDSVYFDQLGIDMVLADEGHQYKNLVKAKQRFGESPKFLGGSGESKTAQDTFYKMKALRANTGGKGVFMLTATPTKNSPLEIYSMISHIAPEAWDELGIRNAEDFIDRFCVMETKSILKLSGEYDDDLCVTGFKNLSELREVMKRYIDRTTAADVGLELPERDDREHLVDMTPTQDRIYEELREMGEKANDAEGEGHIFSIMDKMQKATLDPALLGPSYEGERCPKLELCAKDAARDAAEGGQIIFCEAIDIHDKIAGLIEKAGIPRDRIAIINGATCPTGDSRQKISDAFNEGRIDVVIANKTAEQGVNLQKRTSDIRHLDIPWEPATLQQRNGRGLRQGNTKAAVRIHTYMARGSMDGYRWQTVAAKKDWMDLLWNGGERVENLAMAAMSQEERMIALSKDPEATRKKMAEDKDLAEAKQKAAERGKASDQFSRVLDMKRSLSELREKAAARAKEADKPVPAPSAAMLRLEHRIGVLTDTLRHSKWFTHKDLLDSDKPVYIEPSTDTAWTEGQGFEMAPSGGPMRWSDKPTRWVVTGIDLAGGDPTITARLWGKNELNAIFKMDAEDFKAGMTQIPYSAEDEAAHIEALRQEAEAKKRKEDEERPVRHLGDVMTMPPVVVQARAADLQRQLKDEHRKFGDYGWNGPVPLIDPEGNATVYRFKSREKMDTHDFMLPTPENREKAIRAYVQTAMSRDLLTRYSVGRGGRSGDPNGVKAQYPAGNGERLSFDNNPWEGILGMLYGSDAVKEAQAGAQKQAIEQIKSAPDFAAAMKAAQTTTGLSLHGGYPGQKDWQPGVAQALWDKAAELGVLHDTLHDAAGRGGHSGLYKIARGGSSWQTHNTASKVGDFLNDLLPEAERREMPEAPPEPEPEPEATPEPEAPPPPPPEPAADDADVKAWKEAGGNGDAGPTMAELRALPRTKYTTQKGKVLTGVIARNMTYQQAKAIDRFTFKNDGGYFVREKHL